MANMSNIQISADFEKQLLTGLRQSIERTLNGDRTKVVAGRISHLDNEQIDLGQVASGVPAGTKLTGELKEDSYVAYKTKDEIVAYELDMKATTRIPHNILGKNEEGSSMFKEPVREALQRGAQVAGLIGYYVHSYNGPRLDEAAINVVSQLLPNRGEGDGDFEFLKKFDKSGFRHTRVNGSGHDSPVDGDNRDHHYRYNSNNVELYIAKEALSKVLERIEARLKQIGACEGTVIDPNRTEIVAKPSKQNRTKG
jgi:hypothetical protein